MPRTIAEHADAVAALLREGLSHRSVESLPVDAALIAATPDRHPGRVLAADVRTPIALPPFDNSQMDGFAVRSAELGDAGATLPVGPMIVAGAGILDLAPGTAMPIMTGAPIPRGADAVVQVERALPAAFPAEGGSVTLPGGIVPGTFIRSAGSDAGEGDLLLQGGTRLGPAQWGVLAAAGVAAVEVQRRFRVIVVSTGLELSPVGEPLEPGRIHDANSASLGASLAGLGLEVAVETLRSDEPAELLTLLRSRSFDLLITSGGVSAGAHEVVRLALEPLGVAFTSVAMQPGGPQGLGFAELDGRLVPVVALPGNPVSVLVSFEAFLRPALREAAGLRRTRRDVERLPLAEALDSPAGKHQLRRALVHGGAVHMIGGPSSHLLGHYALADALAHVPVGVERMEAGEPIEIWRIDD